MAAVLCAGAPVARAQSLTKTATLVDSNGNGFFDLDETIQYHLVFTNTTGADLVNAVIRDVVTNDLDPRFVSDPSVLVIDAGGTYSAATGRIEWNSATTPELLVLSGGGTVSLGFSTRVDPSILGGQYIPNTLLVTW